MQSQAFQTTPEQGWVPVADWRFESYAKRSAFAATNADWMKHVPVMSATVLGLELLMQERCIDLQLASELVLSDVGATIQVLRLVGCEYPSASERPSRMDVCLSALDVDTWFSAICANTFPSTRKQAELGAVWQHCRLVGQYAKLIAESLDGVSSDDAYLAGLLHEVETIPAVLGEGGADTFGAELTIEQILPTSVLAALQSARERGSSSIWRYILSSAHALAAVTAGSDPLRAHGSFQDALNA